MQLKMCVPLLHFNEDISLKCYETMGALKTRLTSYFWYYHSERLHQSLDDALPYAMIKASGRRNKSGLRRLTYTLKNYFFVLTKGRSI
jgi:hypothetical protein